MPAPLLSLRAVTLPLIGDGGPISSDVPHRPALDRFVAAAVAMAGPEAPFHYVEWTPDPDRQGVRVGDETGYVYLMPIANPAGVPGAMPWWQIGRSVHGQLVEHHEGPDVDTLVRVWLPISGQWEAPSLVRSGTDLLVKQPADLTRRTAALLIDGIITTLVMWGGAELLILLFGDRSGWGAFSVAATFFLTIWLGRAALVAWWGRTPGQAAVGIRMDRGAPGVRLGKVLALFGRGLLTTLSCALTIIGLILALTRGDGGRTGVDQMSGTYVREPALRIPGRFLSRR